VGIVAVGIDLAKNVYALHGVDETGKVVLRRPSVKRDQLLEFFAKLPPCLVGMEACGGAHEWARKLKALGHDARLMAPKLVAPYRDGGKRKKNDAVDAEAICEAVQRKKMRFVPIKSEEQQSRLAVHTAREGYVAQRTATINRIRGLLTEVGIVMPKKAATIRKLAHEHLEDLPGYLNQVVNDLLDELGRLDLRVAQYDVLIREMARQDSRSQRLMQINGIGEITASALVALVGNGHDFKNARQFAAWLGLVPRQFGSGGKVQLGRITKVGDPYLRKLLVMGARAVLNAAEGKTDRMSVWALQLKERRGYGKALVAIAAKNARIAWAMLSKGQDFREALKEA
jgi:transposase